MEIADLGVEWTRAHQVAAGENFIWPRPAPGALRGASAMSVCVGAPAGCLDRCRH